MEMTLTLMQVRTIENELMRQNGQKIIDGVMDEPITKTKLATPEPNVMGVPETAVVVMPEKGERFYVDPYGKLL